MDERFKSAIEKIKKLAEAHPEFGSELRKELGMPPRVDKAVLSNVEKYLGLDYNQDTALSLIDYSFVQDETTRNILEADNREMMRFRYGTRAHKVDFESFCSYVHLQAEMLLNYYYTVVEEGDDEKIREHICKYYEKASTLKGTSVESISFAVKWYAFKNEAELKLYPPDDNLDYARIIRNAQFHRNPETEGRTSIDEMIKQLEEKKFRLKPNGAVVQYKLSEEQKIIIQSKQYKDYLFLVWRKRMPYTEICNSLNELAIKVKDKISVSQGVSSISK